MPVYEYECEKCKNIEELLVTSIKDIKENPVCKCGGQTKKIISRSSFHLKGGGWYSDGYSDKPTGPPPENTSCGPGITTCSPIIKDRNTGNTLVGPEVPKE